MKGMSIETALVLVQEILGQNQLTEVQEAVFRGVWLRQSYQDIINTAAENGYYYSLGYLKNTGSELWQTLSEALGERITKINLQEVLERYQRQKLMHPTIRQDWDGAVAPINFRGRTQELATLKQWLSDRRIISILGMGGMGKSALAVRLAQEVLQVNGTLNSTSNVAIQKDSASDKHSASPPFSSFFWRSLLNAPPIEETLQEMVQFLSQQQEIDLPTAIEGKIARVVHYFRENRCLVVLDNLESVLQSGSSAGVYRPGYEGYGLLLQRIGEANHSSCLVLTSREKPREIAWLEGIDSPVCSFSLKGLATTEAQAIFASKGCFGITETELQGVIEHYAGNPFALNMLASTVQELFDGDMTELLPLLQQGRLQFEDINDVLNRQFARLSTVEQDVMYWLAINREPVSHTELAADIVSVTVKQQLLEALKSLGRRFLVERNEKQWSLQPVVMEYVTNRFIAQICEEIGQQRYELLSSHAMLKAQSKDYIRQAQSCLILQPLLDCLSGRLGGRKNVEYQLKELLEKQRIEAPLQPGYGGGNILNLLRQLGADLSHINGSYLNIWQADLQGVALHNADFSHADLSRSVFTATLNATLSVAFSPDGRLFAAGNADSKVRIWRITDGQELLTCEGHNSWVASIAFNPDGQTIASASFDQTIKIWSLTTGECLTTLQSQTSQLWAAIQFSPDGQWLVSAGHEHNAIKLWNVKTGQTVHTLNQHRGLVFTVAFSPDGRLLASGSDDQTICLWDVQTGKLLKTIEGHTGWVRSVVFALDGKTLISGSNDCTIKCWDLTTGECLNTLQGHQHLIISMALSVDGHTLASSSQDCTVRIWNIVTGQCLRVLQGHPNGVWSAAFHPDGQTLISGSNDSTVKIWNVHTGHSLRTIQGYSSGIRTISFSPDDKLLASAGDDKQIKLWDVRTGELLQQLSGHTSWIWSVTFTSDGRLLASGSNDGSVRIWDAATGQLRQAMTEHANLVMSVAFSPDDQTLLSGCTDQTIKQWNVQSGKCLQTLSCTGRVWAVAFVNSQQFVSGHDDNTAKLWDLESATCLRTFQGHQGLVFTVAISPDRNLLATGSQDQTIKLWDLRSGHCLQTFGCGSQIWSIAFSADGQTLVSGTSDTLVRLWNVQTGHCERILADHVGEVWSVACSSTGSIAASGGQQGVVHFWDLTSGVPIKKLQNQRPYEGMKISQTTGLATAQKETLVALGAID